MQQPRPASGASLGQCPGGTCVAQEGEFRLVLGAVHRRMRGRVDDDVGRQAPDEVRQRTGIAKVAYLAGCVVGQLAFAGGAGDLAERGKAALQFGADLAVRSQQQDAHG